ncbi:MAG: DUF6127 family protein [Pseudomonadota bacterium]
MSREELLARLIAQADSENADLVTLRAIVEESSELGAARALEHLGLADDTARRDMAELRELLGAWHEAKSSMWHAFISWTVRGLLALLLIGIAVRLGLWGWEI